MTYTELVEYCANQSFLNGIYSLPEDMPELSSEQASDLERYIANKVEELRKEAAQHRENNTDYYQRAYAMYKEILESIRSTIAYNEQYEYTATITEEQMQELNRARLYGVTEADISYIKQRLQINTIVIGPVTHRL